MRLKPKVYKEKTTAESVVDFICVVLALGALLMTASIILFNLGR